MKRKSSIVMALLLICSFVLTTSAYAGTLRASDQISAYSMDAGPMSGGQIAIEFSITTSYQMAILGAKTITIYEKNGTSWVRAGGYTQNDSGMTRTNAYHYSNTMYFNGEAGTEYKIYAKVFAEDSAGESDSRSRVFYVTAE